MSDTSNFKDRYFYDILPKGDYNTTVEFLQSIVDLQYSHIKKSNERDEKVLNFFYPDDLRSKLDLEIPTDPLSLEEIQKDCKNTMDYCVKTGHPRFFNQLFQGLDLISLAAQWVTSTTNASMYTYEIAPVYTLIEEVTLKKMSEIIGWTEPSDGLFNPGGTISNLYAIQTARFHYFPQVKDEGLFGLPKIIIFASEHCHYSIDKAVSILGIGRNQLKKVPVDKNGKLMPEKLELMIKESLKLNEVPFMVVLTAGTTVVGAFDPIEPVTEICQRYKLWLHIDAAWGGGALLSKKHKHLLKGIEKADSVTWNPHKLMGALLQCSAFLVKKKGLLQTCNQTNATYLFQKDKHYDVTYDTGDKTIQCGRHVDVFKVWLMWRAKGDSGFEKQIDKSFDLARLLFNEIKSRQNFEIVFSEPEMTNICFWYIPNSIKHLDRNSDEYKMKLHQVAPKIKEKMMIKGSMMIGYQPIDNKPNFFRVVILNDATTEKDIHFLIKEIEDLGHDI